MYYLLFTIISICIFIIICICIFISISIIEVVYCLLDEDGDRNLSTKEFNPVLFSWRHSRGFQNGALSVTLGNMKF